MTGAEAYWTPERLASLRRAVIVDLSRVRPDSNVQLAICEAIQQALQADAAPLASNLLHTLIAERNGMSTTLMMAFAAMAEDRQANHLDPERN